MIESSCQLSLDTVHRKLCLMREFAIPLLFPLIVVSEFGASASDSSVSGSI